MGNNKQNYKRIQLCHKNKISIMAITITTARNKKIMRATKDLLSLNYLKDSTGNKSML